MCETHTATPCHVCRTGWLRTFPAFKELSRVTSDAKPFPRGGGDPPRRRAVQIHERRN